MLENSNKYPLDVQHTMCLNEDMKKNWHIKNGARSLYWSELRYTEHSTDPMGWTTWSNAQFFTLAEAWGIVQREGMDDVVIVDRITAERQELPKLGMDPVAQIRARA